MHKVGRSVVFTAVLAALVTAAALTMAAIVRWHRPSGLPGAAPARASGVSGVATGCGEGPCVVLSSQNVNGQMVRLLADANGDNGRFEAGDEVIEAAVTTLGARLNRNSLSCVSASVAACLIDAPENGGKIAQLLIERAGVWRSVDQPYFSTAGVVVLTDVSGSDAPEVVVVENSPVLARVYSLDGTVVGCTRHYPSVTAIRGWPNVHLVAADIRACSA